MKLLQQAKLMHIEPQAMGEADFENYFKFGIFAIM